MLNSDGGAFPEYLRAFLMTAFTLIVQLALMNISILVTINGHLIYAIAIAITSVNTPMLLSKYLVRPNRKYNKFSRKYGKEFESIITKKEEIENRNFTRNNRSIKEYRNCNWWNNIYYSTN